jgi:phage shock protein A
MVIPDWLFKIFAAIGLVDSEEKKINKMVAGCKDELRRLRSLLEEQITEVANIEREIKKLQPKYEEAQGPAKGAYAEMIKA